jgi:competence ComEA-like helix-hairpin-helix protein
MRRIKRQTSGVRGLVHLIAAIAVAAVAVAFGRWLRDPVPGGALLALLAAGIVCAVALRHLYRPGGVGRRAPRSGAEAESPADDRLDLNTASAAELARVAGIGPVGARLIVDERERNGPFRAPGDLARVAGFGPSRVRGLAGRVRAGG